MSETMINAMRQALQEATRILVVSHIRPDGDAIGSLLGFGLALQAVGKTVTMVSVDGVPATLRHLPGSEQICTKPEGEFDLVAVVDCSELARVGSALPPEAVPDFNIDHHVTNLNFARFNLVQPAAAATAEVLTNLLPGLGLPLTLEVAAALLTGMVTDTLGFRTSSVTPGLMRTAANLMEMGAHLGDLYRRALIQRSYAAARYWGVGLSKLQRDGRLVWTTLTLADRRAVEYPGRDDADLINIVSAVEGADIALVFVEQTDQRVKISWRAHSGYDVSQVALSFGGGGHKAAAGAEVSGSLEDVQAQVLAATRALLVKA
jgi:phosphoesterase RecJ-like protein